MFFSGLEKPQPNYEPSQPEIVPRKPLLLGCRPFVRRPTKRVVTIPDEVTDICTRKRTRPVPMSVYNPPKGMRKCWRAKGRDEKHVEEKGKKERRKSRGKEPRVKDHEENRKDERREEEGKENRYEKGKKNKKRNGEEKENWSEED